MPQLDLCLQRREIHDMRPFRQECRLHPVHDSLIVVIQCANTLVGEQAAYDAYQRLEAAVLEVFGEEHLALMAIGGQRLSGLEISATRRLNRILPVGAEGADEPSHLPEPRRSCCRQARVVERLMAQDVAFLPPDDLPQAVHPVHHRIACVVLHAAPILLAGNNERQPDKRTGAWNRSFWELKELYHASDGAARRLQTDPKPAPLLDHQALQQIIRHGLEGIKILWVGPFSAY